ncbi:MAG: hypothetical protein ABIJ31_14865 [Pseudomonadota bacterium]
MPGYTIKLLPVKENITFTPAEWQTILLFNESPDFDKLIHLLKTKHHMDIKNIESMLMELQKKGAIKLLKTRTEELGVDIPVLFWDTIKMELSKSIGPIASLVIDDSVNEFNYSKKNFPKKLLFSFVEKVANEISSAAEKNQFQKTMLNFIKQNI